MLIVALVATAGCAALRRQSKAGRDMMQSRQLTQQAQRDMHRQQWQQAEENLVEAVRCCPEDGDARECLADVLWNRGAAEAAIAELTKAVDLSGGQDPHLLVRLGRMYLVRGDLNAALARADAAREIDRAHAGAWALRGEVLLQQGQLQPALASLYRALSEDPDNACLRITLARVFQQQGRPHRAVATLEAVGPHQLTDAQLTQQFWMQKGKSLASLRRFAEARQALVAARQASAPSSELLCELAEVQLATGDVSAARRTAEEALQLAREPQQGAVHQLIARIERTSESR
jgi:Flp pilus assembly protein TadD